MSTREREPGEGIHASGTDEEEGNARGRAWLSLSIACVALSPRLG